MPTPDINPEAMQKVVSLVQDLGYRAHYNVENQRIDSKMSGFSVSIFVVPGKNVQFYCGIALGEEAGFNLEQVNTFNRSYRFAKAYRTESGIGLELDYLFNADADDAAAQLETMVDLWEGTLSLLRDDITAARTSSAAAPDQPSDKSYS